MLGVGEPGPPPHPLLGVAKDAVDGLRFTGTLKLLLECRTAGHFTPITRQAATLREKPLAIVKRDGEDSPTVAGRLSLQACSWPEVRMTNRCVLAAGVVLAAALGAAQAHAQM